MNTHNKIREIVGIALLMAIMVVLQLVATYLPKLPGGLTLNLTLIPLVIAAILYKYKGAIILGLCNACIVLIDPATVVFYNASLFGTILIVIIKSVIAGITATFIYSLLREKAKTFGIILVSILVPLINTTIFVIGSIIFFTEVYGGGLNVILIAIIPNFVLEICLNAVLAPIVVIIIDVLNKKYHLIEK